jgi:hypothetical protein
VNLTAVASLVLVAGALLSTGCGGSDSSSSGSALMAPGQDCTRCHPFTVAGTVFDAAGNGVQGVDVVLGGVTLTSNAAGNFFTAGAVTLPARVELRRGGATVAAMPALAPGACNQCHGVSQARVTVP